jgi:uncharacterized membrane protein YcaP (DUF421 family)
LSWLRAAADWYAVEDIGDQVTAECSASTNPGEQEEHAMLWISGNWQLLGTVAGKAVLMYATALVGLRLGERRTLAEWGIIDFVPAVAIGAIVGRTAIASTQSFLTGGVALVTLIAAHQLASRLRHHSVLGTLLEHRVRVLLAHGRVHHLQLRRCGLTENDLFAQLRQKGILQLKDIRYVLYEATGGLTIVHENDDPQADLLQAALHHALGLDRQQP